MAKAPGKLAGSLGNTKYYYTKDGKIVDEAGKPVSDKIAVAFEPAPSAATEPKMEDVFPETFAGGKKQRKTRASVDTDKESSEYKRNAQELRMTFENVEDLLRDNNVILKDQIVLQERSLVLLEEVVQAIKNKTGGGGGGNLPNIKSSLNLKNIYGKVGNIAKTMNIMSVMADINNLTKEDIENKLNPPADDIMSQPMTKVIGDWWSGGKQDDAASLQPKTTLSVAPGSEGKDTAALVAEMTARAEAAKNDAGTKTNGTKQTAAVTAAAAAKVQSKNTLTFKGDELKFIADKLTFDVQTLKIESKTAPQNNQQAGAPAAPTPAAPGTGGPNALGNGPGPQQSGVVNTPGGTAAPDRSRNLGNPAFTGNTGAGTTGPSFAGMGAGGGQPLKLGRSAVNPQEMYSYLRSKGVDHEHAVGMLANVQAESNFNSSSIGDNGTSGGLFQHHNERFAAMKRAAGPDWNKNWKGQIDYALTEPETKKYLKRQVGSGQEAARYFVGDFEKPKYAAAAMQARVGMAGNFETFSTSTAATAPVPVAAATTPAPAATATAKPAVGSGRGSGEAEMAQRHADSVGGGRGNIVEKDGERAAANRVWQKDYKGREGQWVREGRNTHFIARADIEAQEQSKNVEEDTRAKYIEEARSNAAKTTNPLALGNAKMEAAIQTAKLEESKPKYSAGALAMGMIPPSSLGVPPNPGRGSGAYREQAGEREKYQKTSKKNNRLDHETPKTVAPGGDMMSNAANKHPYLPIAAAMGLLAAAVGIAAMRGHR